MLTPPHRLEVCPQEEIVFTCNGSNSSIVVIEWRIQFVVGSSVQINGRIRNTNNNMFLGVALSEEDSLGHMYFYMLTSQTPTTSSTLSTTAAPHLNGSIVECVEFIIAGTSTQSEPAMIVVTGMSKT